MHSRPELLNDIDQRAAPPAPPNMAPFADIPRPIWTAFLSTWAVLFGLFVIFFARDGRAALMVVTASFFALMTLGLPAALSLQSPSAPREHPRIIVTGSGPLPVSAAATQILLIPVAALIGLAAFILLAM